METETLQLKFTNGYRAPTILKIIFLGVGMDREMIKIKAKFQSALCKRRNKTT